ncbi:uncharacterized protein LOC124660863 [Lolium rigidum]|uniref:uncharacterized protein LOC124660863 n=1 Tax=Lolium rigidum TaxID=89674 RepID=UPI001F5D516F|nr:uncharacterized protein LOC124660863 [Lolium rigidum]
MVKNRNAFRLIEAPTDWRVVCLSSPLSPSIISSPPPRPLPSLSPCRPALPSSPAIPCHGLAGSPAVCDVDDQWCRRLLWILEAALAGSPLLLPEDDHEVHDHVGHAKCERTIETEEACRSGSSWKQMNTSVQGFLHRPIPATNLRFVIEDMAFIFDLNSRCTLELVKNCMWYIASGLMVQIYKEHI